MLTLNICATEATKKQLSALSRQLSAMKSALSFRLWALARKQERAAPAAPTLGTGYSVLYVKYWVLLLLQSQWRFSRADDRCRCRCRGWNRRKDAVRHRYA